MTATTHHIDQSLNRAKSNLCHYFRILFDRADFSWGSDNVSEVESIVDDIYEAAVEAADGPEDEDLAETQPQDTVALEAACVKAVNDIVKDLSGRRGLKWEWEAINADIKDEIKGVWAGIIAAAIKDHVK